MQKDRYTTRIMVRATVAEREAANPGSQSRAVAVGLCQAPATAAVQPGCLRAAPRWD
jgi:hypothetical protein